MMGKERNGYGRRFLLPVAVFLGGWLLADLLLTLIVRQPFPLADTPVYRPAMTVLARGRILSLLLGGIIIYPVLFFQGATFVERLLGVFALPLAYVVTSVIHATAYFPIGEALYYGLNPVAVSSLLLQTATSSIADVCCRWWVWRRGDAQRPIVRWLHLVAMLAGILGGYATLLWNGGERWFYLYQAGYQFLFQ